MAALDYEAWIDMTIAELLDNVAKKNMFDLSSTILWYTMDAAARFSFGVPLGCLAAEDDVSGSIQLIRDRFTHWGRWSSLPWLKRLVYRNLFFKYVKRTPSSMAAAAIKKLEARTRGVGVSKEKKEASVAPPDLLQRFLETRKDFPQALDGQGIIGMLMNTILGVGDTTSVAVTTAIYHLLKILETMKKLEAELTNAGIPEIPAFAEVAKLPYLGAVIKESMRVFSPGAWPMERLVPAGGATIASMYFPEGMSVGCLSAAVHLNNKVFGEDVGVFRPERWLVSNSEQLRLMEASHMGFSHGRRNCLGQNIAMLQMKKVIPALLMKFKVSLLDCEMSSGQKGWLTDILRSLVSWTRMRCSRPIFLRV
jgi:cytochrome P450